MQCKLRNIFPIAAIFCLIGCGNPDEQAAKLYAEALADVRTYKSADILQSKEIEPIQEAYAAVTNALSKANSIIAHYPSTPIGIKLQSEGCFQLDGEITTLKQLESAADSLQTLLMNFPASKLYSEAINDLKPLIKVVASETLPTKTQIQEAHIALVNAISKADTIIADYPSSDGAIQLKTKGFIIEGEFKTLDECRKAEKKYKNILSANNYKKFFAQTAATRCQTNLEYIAFSFSVYAIDNGNRYPWQIPASEGGTLEMASQYKDGSDKNTAGHFNAKELQNIMPSPVTLICPADTKDALKNWEIPLSEDNISYKLRTAADVKTTNPNAVMLWCPIHKTYARCDGKVVRTDSIGIELENAIIAGTK